MVPSPGVWPAAISAAIRGSRSAKTASATGPPGSMRAVIVGSSVLELALAGEDHRHTELVGPGDVLVVVHRAAGLDDHGDAGRGGCLDAVGERVERVAGARPALGPAGGLLGGDLAGL